MLQISKKVFCKLYGPYELYLDTIAVLQFPGECIHFPVSRGDSTDMPKRPTGHQACPFLTHVWIWFCFRASLAAYILRILFPLNRQFFRWYWKKGCQDKRPKQPISWKVILGKKSHPISKGFFSTRIRFVWRIRKFKKHVQRRQNLPEDTTIPGFFLVWLVPTTQQVPVQVEKNERYTCEFLCLEDEKSCLGVPKIMIFAPKDSGTLSRNCQNSEVGSGFKYFLFSSWSYLGKWWNLTNIFQMGWNHQLENLKLQSYHGFWV